MERPSRAGHKVFLKEPLMFCKALLDAKNKQHAHDNNNQRAQNGQSLCGMCTNRVSLDWWQHTRDFLTLGNSAFLCVCNPFVVQAARLHSDTSDAKPAIRHPIPETPVRDMDGQLNFRSSQTSVLELLVHKDKERGRAVEAAPS